MTDDKESAQKAINRRFICSYTNPSGKDETFPKAAVRRE
jgi:hypothetical protein